MLRSQDVPQFMSDDAPQVEEVAIAVLANPVVAGRVATELTAGGGRPFVECQPHLLLQQRVAEKVLETGRHLPGDDVAVERIKIVRFVDQIGQRVGSRGREK
jgi:hypothetical protein